MIDLGGLDLDLTYEDGLRLSELLGTRAELAYALDHILMHSLSVVIALIVILLATWMFIASVIEMFKKDKEYSERVYEDNAEYGTFKPRPRLLYRAEVREDCQAFGYFGKETKWYKQTVYTLSRLRIAVVTFIPMLALIIVGVVLILVFAEYDLTRQLAGVDAQIEELLSRYGVI